MIRLGELLQSARRFIPWRSRRSRQELYRHVFESPEGKLVLQHILRGGYVFRSTFVAGDPHRTVLNEGRRWLALDILKFINKDPNELLKQIEDGMENDRYVNIQKNTNGSRP